MASIRCPLYEAFSVSPLQAACLDGDRIRMFQDMEKDVSGFTPLLDALSIGADSRVALCLPNSYFFCVLFFALLRRGALPVLLSPRDPDAVRQKRLAQAKATQCIDEAQLAKLLEVHRPGIPTKTLPMFDLEKPTSLIFTSGSSGQAKPVLHPFRAHYYSALGAHRNMRLRSGHRWLISLPMHHVGGLAILFRCIQGSAATVFPREGESLLTELQRSQATHVSLVPAQLRRLLAEERGATILASLEAVLLGGSAIPADLIDACVEAKIPLHTTYGCSECASQISTTEPFASRETLGTAGRPLSFRELTIGPEGDILVRGPILALELPLDKDGWYATGDQGKLDEQGRLTVLGRRDGLIISGGENIMPEEIEAALLAFPEIHQAIVVGRTDKEFGQRPVAFVDAPAGIPDDLAERLKSSLPSFKVPDTFLALPENNGLKPQRAELQQLAEASS